MKPYFEEDGVRLFVGDCREVLASLPAESAQCCVTSPPYWQKADYGHPEQLGVESTPGAFVAAMVETFREVRRVLVPGGALWLNLGDSYASGGRGGGGGALNRATQGTVAARTGWRKQPPGYKDKDLTLTPFQVAEALRADGWFLRQVVVWAKPCAVEAQRADRPSVSHEYVFLLSSTADCAARSPGEAWWGLSVWEIPTAGRVQGFPAPMPEELARRCVVAGSRPGDVVLDPFSGSGTTGLVALKSGRRFIGAELNPTYAEMSLVRMSPGRAA